MEVLQELGQKNTLRSYCVPGFYDFDNKEIANLGQQSSPCKKKKKLAIER